MLGLRAQGSGLRLLVDDGRTQLLLLERARNTAWEGWFVALAPTYSASDALALGEK